MKLHPFHKCVADACKLLDKRPDAIVYQQWNCAHCGAKQTMDVPGTFFELGTCEACGEETDVMHDGCNFMVVVGFRRRK